MIIYFLAIIVIVASLYSLYKRYTINKKQTLEKKETLNETPLRSGANKIDLLTSGDRPAIGEKNKWLHPTDGFGKMEKGVVD